MRFEAHRRHLLNFACPFFAVAVLCGLGPARAYSEEAEGQSVEAWAFLDAWRTFRYEVDASIEDERVWLAVERLREQPDWLWRDALRLVTHDDAAEVLAQQANRRRDQQGIPPLRQLHGRQPLEAVTEALVSLEDDATISQLLALVEKGAPRQQWRAARLLGQSGRAGRQALRRKLPLRAPVAAALAAHGDAQAQRWLRRELERPNLIRRIEAAHGLASAGDRRALPLLRQLVVRKAHNPHRVLRSLGLVGQLEDRHLLRSHWGALSAEQSPLLHEELHVTLGRLWLGDYLGRGPRKLRRAWAEPVGALVAQEITSPAAVMKALRQRLTPHRGAVDDSLSQKRHLQHLLAHLQREPPLPPLPPLPTERTVEDLHTSLALSRTQREEGSGRLARLDAALALLHLLGQRLGHKVLADPPNVRTAGLGADRAVDGNLLTSWVAGSGAKSLQLELPTARSVSALSVIGGCVTSRRSYLSHARVARVAVQTTPGRWHEGRLRDGDPYFQRIPLPPARTKQISIKVTGQYAGKVPDAPPCLAEVRLHH
jgi:hypothetical protein